ncbi:unnamed protein product [Caenorhabditis auriculariae]|uniref:ANK_REP_REGION domain-containing protein n=1 Tax=Caenorhabditis auriculariae TaxID=2777116 RepID=A0A8S1GUG9_9PELO|nr:unnamed protein product [Caenorhabditis auriculariae]
MRQSAVVEMSPRHPMRPDARGVGYLEDFAPGHEMRRIWEAKSSWQRGKLRRRKVRLELVLSRHDYPAIQRLLIAFSIVLQLAFSMFRSYARSLASNMSLIRALDKLDRDETARILETMPSEVSVRDEEDRVALHYAAEVCDLETFQRIFNENPTLLDVTDKNGHTPLLNALMAGRIDIAEFLTSKGANVHQIDKEGHNAVHWTAVCGQVEALNWAVSKGVEVNAHDSTQNACPLHYATVADEVPAELALSVLVTLLKHGANANCKDKDERTPILWCASNGNVQAMNTLKQAGGDMLAKDRDHLGALHCAASHGYHEVIELVMNSISAKHVDEEDRAGHTALFYAVTFGHYESALKLLQYGANPNHQDHRLRTPCHCAAAKGQMRMLKLLRQHNASFEIQNYRGDMSFHEAVQTGSKDVVEWLLAMDPSTLDAPNHQGRTALHLAAASGNLEMVIFLCSKKCFVDPLMLYKDVIYTPLDIAKKQKHEVIVEYLTQQFNAQSSDQMEPETVQKWRLSFEEQIVQAKLDRVKRIAESHKLAEEEENPKKRSIISEKAVKIDAAVNTSSRQLSSAGSSVRVALTKATSTTQLEEVKEPLEKKVVVNEEKAKLFNVDEDFENLPAISDESEYETEKEEEEEEEAGEEGDVDQKVMDKENIKRRSKSLPKLNSGKEKAGDGSKKKDTKTKVMMRVRREPEFGNDVGEFEIYEDDWEQVPNVKRAVGKDANRKYIHEKAIFQELTHLKRMQIQYGKVQERILVRSLVANFCKMHGLDPANFKFHTFYAWEKFLYEQLKTIYLDERERLTQARGDGDKFQKRAARSVPFNEKMKEMRRAYNGGLTASTAAANRHKKLFEGGKRCDCLDKHLLLQ